MHVPAFIERKRDGGEVSAGEIEEFIRGYISGEIPNFKTSKNSTSHSSPQS